MWGTLGAAEWSLRLALDAGRSPAFGRKKEKSDGAGSANLPVAILLLEKQGNLS